jgi:hypothetical protein
MWLNYHSKVATVWLGLYKLLILRNKLEDYCMTLC